MAKVYIDPGHGGSDPGAVKYIREEDVNLTMALACRDYLKKYGVTVKMSRTSDKDTSLNATCAEINKWKPDLAVSVHNNAGGGDGFEVYHSICGGTGKVLAKNIEDEVKKIGQNSRGLKTKKNSSGKDYYGFIRQTTCPAIICEGVFVDNKKDAAQADTKAEQEEFGIAYAKGILKTLGINTTPAKKYKALSDMNFRKTASTSGAKIGIIPEGTILTGKVDKNGWLKTTYNGKAGYVRQEGSKVYCKEV